MRMTDTGLETLVLKWTFGAMFVGVVAIFAGKMAVLLFTVAKVKLAALKAWILSGEFLRALAESVKDALLGGGK